MTTFKWIVAILVLVGLISLAEYLYQFNTTYTAGIVFFIILPYVGIMITTAYERGTEDND